MVLETVVGKFITLFRAVRPQIAIHRIVDGFAVFIQTRAPVVVPKPAPVRLFFKADDFRNIGALRLRRLKRPQLRQT